MEAFYPLLFPLALHGKEKREKRDGKEREGGRWGSRGDPLLSFFSMIFSATSSRSKKGEGGGGEKKKRREPNKTGGSIF